ncbi:MAG: ditFa [Ilumatobacteraceae bacterium]|nr:ditFa [Ilumatobacteraceae bacterium]
MTDTTTHGPYRGAPSRAIAGISPDAWTAPFWTAALEHRLVAARCTECATFQVPPTGFCPKCRARSIEWVQLSGLATIYSFTVVRHAVVAQLAETVPYVIGVVKLDGADDSKLMTNIVDCDPDTVRIGQSVHVVWDDIDAEVTIPRFAPHSEGLQP